jgi:hypothetical protein
MPCPCRTASNQGKETSQIQKLGGLFRFFLVGDFFSAHTQIELSFFHEYPATAGYFLHQIGHTHHDVSVEETRHGRDT